jgi:hypothetical protein
VFSTKPVPSIDRLHPVPKKTQSQFNFIADIFFTLPKSITALQSGTPHKLLHAELILPSIKFNLVSEPVL